jgi:diaminohydroxyphosphoribosylaminopyrimidine deaminase/5-amino-6-(5-phosphoribosylamino)uracil reductase
MNADAPAGDLIDRAMRRALRLAARGRGWTSPNPMVGAVLLRDGQIIGEGWHTAVGRAHAEREALTDCRRRGHNPAGATMVVNLEPCNHIGRTPPCTDALLEAGVSRVIIAHQDPNPQVDGAGIRRLREAGVTVDFGPYADASIQLNEVYCRYICAERPFVTLKAAITLDGKLATASGHSQWVSGLLARRYAHWLRHVHDAVLVGANTVLADDPQLNCRLPADRPYRQPWRVVLDSKSRTPPDARLFRSQPAGPVLIAATAAAPPAARDRLAKAGAMVEIFPADGRGQVDLAALLRFLRAREIASVLVEGGGLVHAGFLGARLADKMDLVLAPKILGGREAVSWVGRELAQMMDQARAVRGLHARRLGDDLLMEGYFEDIGECLRA